jgi:predicted ATPase/DNA-binding winged helix-turn-helix (wHTH) protein
MCNDHGVIVRFDAFQLDDQRLTLTGPDGPIHLERQVFDVLLHLVNHRDRVVTKEELLDSIWGDRFVSESALTSRIKDARRAIGDDGVAQRLIKTVHSRGYHFVGDVTESAHDTGGAANRPLPRLRTPPIGRDDDIAQVGARVRGGSLVTITGPGGVGKTTVALAVANQMATAFGEGAVFVDLTPVLPGGDPTRAVATALGIEGVASTSLDGLAGHLASRPMLLVLDNCEHVLDGAAQLADGMLERGSTAHVLATSREPLGVTGEQLWPLGPLGDAGPLVFVERARAAEPRVAWQADHPVIVDLCRRLDNIPLAIELAAGQLRRLDISELTSDLAGHLALPSTRSGRDGSRHSTMEATVDWSYQLLDDDEQRLLRHLSVFPASFDRPAVEGSAPAFTPSVDALLAQLVDKSLVARELWSGRYRLLELIRMFARERLDEAGEADEALERHRRHVLRRVTATTRLDRWMSAKLGAEYRTTLDDSRQATRLCLERGDVAGAVEIAVGASFLWRNTIGCTEGDALTATLLEHPLSEQDRLWVNILRADVGQGQGDFVQMFEANATAADLVDTTDDQAAACILSHYGALAHLTDPTRSHAELARPAELANAAGDPRLVNLVDAFLAVADTGSGDVAKARHRVTHLMDAASSDGYDRFISHWAGWILALYERDAGGARGWMTLQEEFLDRTGIVETWWTLFSSGMCDVLDGVDPRETLERVLAVASREGHRAEADCVLELAFAEICADRFEVAAELLGTALQDRFNATAHYVTYRIVLDHALRQHLDDHTIRTAMARGASRSAVEVLAEHGVATSASA